ncbi:MAG: GtrA family protein, partial [Rhizobiaceae bacterium]
MAEPAMVATYYCTPFLAALTLVLRARKVRPGRDELVFGAFLFAAILVSLWQVRGVFFSIPLSVVPLAVWVGEWRARIARKPVKGGAVKLVAVWLLSFNVVWSSVAEAAISRLAPQKAVSGSGVSAGACLAPDDYGLLAAMPKATVLAVSNLGAPILRYTPHRVLAGPYHRNVEGDLAALNAFIGTDEEALAIVRRYGVTLVASCPGNDETRSLEREAPDGLAARLARNDVPAWLAPVPAAADQPLRLFRVVLK